MTTLDNIATDIQLFYQKILLFYEKEMSDQNKWTNIATFMHENNSVVIKTYQTIKRHIDRKNVSLNYDTDFNQLQKQILTESNSLIKISFIILSLHKIVYDLLSADGNYYFKLIGKEEMHILKKDLIYYINLSVKTEQNVYFHAYILMFALESLFNKYLYVGVDFEYTNKKIQLAQLNFEHNISLKSIIMMVSPNELEPVMMDNFIDTIICNRSIKKILHGSDSLDIPYMYNHMLQSDPKKIIRFTKALIDTRFLCEYYKLNRDETDNRCAIYDEDADRSAIYYFNVVSEEQQNKLSELLDSMPAPHDIVWNIHKMPMSQVLYAQYDVLYLKYYYYRMIYVATADVTNDNDIKDIIVLYRNVLTELTQLVYLENNGITFLKAKCKEDVDVVNNYFIRKTGDIIKMIDIYNQVSKNLTTTNPRTDIDKIIKVNHFKSTIMILIKRITYAFISQKCRIQKDKMTIWTDKWNNDFIFDFLDRLKFKNLSRIFKELEKTIESRVRVICSN